VEKTNCTYRKERKRGGNKSINLLQREKKREKRVTKEPKED